MWVLHTLQWMLMHSSHHGNQNISQVEKGVSLEMLRPCFVFVSTWYLNVLDFYAGEIDLYISYSLETIICGQRLRIWSLQRWTCSCCFLDAETTWPWPWVTVFVWPNLSSCPSHWKFYNKKQVFVVGWVVRSSLQRTNHHSSQWREYMFHQSWLSLRELPFPWIVDGWTCSRTVWLANVILEMWQLVRHGKLRCWAM